MKNTSHIGYLALCFLFCFGVAEHIFSADDLNISAKDIKSVELKPFITDVNVSDVNTTKTATSNPDPNRFATIDSNITKTSDDNSLLSDSLSSNKPQEINATLKDSVKAAVKINYRVKYAKELVLQSKHQVDEARGDLYPKVDLTVSKTRKGTKGYNTQEYLENVGDVTVTYDVFDFGKLVSTVDRTKLTLREQEMKLKGTLEEEVNKIIKAYLDVVYGRLSLSANQRNFERLLKILEIVKIKRDLGAATAGDESSIQASVSNARTLLINTESAYNNAKDYYEFLIGTSTESMNPYETKFDIPLQKFDGLLQEIRSQNTDLNIIKTKIRGKQKELDIHRADTLPKVTLSISNNRKYRYDWVDPTQNGNNRESIAELTLTYNLFDGGKSEAKKSRLLSEVTGYTFDLEYTALDTKWNSQKLYNSVQTNKRTAETLDNEINASRRMVDAYWERFRLSSQDLVTLLQAQRQLNTAELEKLRSEKTMYVDYFDLLTKRGRLLEYFGM